MNHTKTKSIGIVLTIIFLLSFFFSVGMLGKNISASAEEETSKKEYSNAITEELTSKQQEEDYVLQAISDIITFEEESETILKPANESLKIFSSLQEIIGSILSREPFTINGEIIDGAKTKDLNSYYNFSKISKFEIAKWIYDANLISEEQKIEIFCELILQRNFANTTCLEGVISEIYYYSEFANGELAKKIESVLSVPFESNGISTLAISNKASFSSTNFTVTYDADEVSEGNARDVANWFEIIRGKFIELGFRTPILQSKYSEYQIYLDPEPHPDPDKASVLASTFPEERNGNVCASYIKIYNFTSSNYSFSDNPSNYWLMVETFVHEYFHATQNAYNLQRGWFKEACADWSSVAIGSQFGIPYSNTQNWIRKYINSCTDVSMPTLSGYEAVLLPLTIQYLYGGTSAIRSIYEAYTAYDGNNDFYPYNSLIDLREAITKGIKNNGYPSGSFDMAFRYMASYITHPKKSYASVVNTNSWQDEVGKFDTWDITSTFYQKFNGSIDYLSSKYFRVTVPTGYKGGVSVSITFSSARGVAQAYTVDKNTDDFITFYDSTNGYLYAEKSDIGSDINELTLILCNLEDSGSMTFTAEVSLINYGSNISFSGVSRYEERLCYIPRGEYKEFKVTFATSGSKTIQTFGEYDTKLELYSSSGTLLASDDDSGYSLNSLIRYYTSANTSYIIRVKFFSSSKLGDTKLTITPAYGALQTDISALSKYEDIYSITSTSFTWNSFATQYYTRMVRYTSSSNATYIFELDSTFDNYIYVIDPRSAKALIKDIDFNDDGGSNLNAKLTKNLDANVPYLVIYSAYNPSNSSATGDLKLTITKHQHNYNSLTSLHTFTHRHTCNCGDYYDELHIYNSCTPNDITSHRRTCSCGYYYDERHNWVNIGINKIRCIDCMLTYVGTIPGGGINSGGNETNGVGSGLGNGV